VCTAKTPKAIAPATPPPPAPILEQAAPVANMDSETVKNAKKANGTKQYRNPLSISTGASTASNGLSITK